MSLKNVKFQILKQSDKKIHDSFLAVIEAAEISFLNGSYTLEVGGLPFRTTKEAPDGGKELVDILGQESQLISSFQWEFEDSIQLVINRGSDEFSDTLDVILNTATAVQKWNNPQRVPKIAKFVASVREKMGSLATLSSRNILLGTHSEKLFELKAAELEKLEQISRNTFASVSKEALKVRGELESEFSTRKIGLEEDFKKQSLGLTKTLEDREEHVNKRENAIQELQKTLDDRNSKHVRREIRTELKKELVKRSERFAVTTGTTKMRLPIFYFTGSLVIIFGSLFTWITTYGILHFKDVVSNGVVSLIIFSIKQAILGAAFASSSIFFIKWQNAWFIKHADEEFHLKRFELDLDRASWLVEMAMEWKSEKGADIPESLIDKIGSNLFQTEPKKIPDPISPVEQLATTLLGSSSEVLVNLPGGSSLKFDRKALKKLNESEGNTAGGG